MKKNKLILFDWGNIVESHHTGYSCTIAWDDIFKACGYNDEETIFWKLKKYRLSAIPNIKEFEKTYYQIKDEFKLSANFEEFVNNYYKYSDRIEHYEDVRDYEVSLKDRCYIGILSNLTIFDKERLDRQVGLDNYDYVFLSFEMACKKPDLEIFEKVQAQLPFKPEDILFIDDISNNIETAEKLGWKGVCTTGLELDTIKKSCEDFIK